MQTSFKPASSRFSTISCLLVSVFCGLGWIWQARKLRDADHQLALAGGQIRELQETDREFDKRQQALISEISSLKKKFDAVQVALLELDQLFNAELRVSAIDQEAGDEEVVTTSAPDTASALPITVAATGDGQVSSLNVGLSKLLEGPLDRSRLRNLDRRLSDVFGIEGKPYDRILLRIGGSLRFDELLKILVVCSRQNTADGMAVLRVGFLKLPVD